MKQDLKSPSLSGNKNVMGLWQILKKGRRTGAQRSAEPTAADYVDWLWEYMLQTSTTALTLDSMGSLPGTDAETPDRVPPCLPPGETVINRLKILAGLDPVRGAGPAEGVHRLKRKFHVVEVHMRFTEKPDRSVCALRFRIKPNAS